MDRIISFVQGFVSNYLYWVNFPTFGVTDVIEIVVITVVVYGILNWIRTTRAWALFKGIIVILLFVLLAALFQMNTILWLAGKAMNVAIIAIFIVFQPELRKALEQLGHRNILLKPLAVFESNTDGVRFSEKTVGELVRASYEMGAVNTGALIVLEADVDLSEYIRTGIDLDSVISAQLLVNIFEKNTPLHDGAIIVRGDRVVSATCYLPLSDSMFVSKELGTRHRAALGISEVSDSLTIVVSEETGAVSVVRGGKIERNMSPGQLELALEQFRNPNGPQQKTGKVKKQRKFKRERRAGNAEEIS